MTPDARLQAAIELLDEVDESNRQKGLPVDELIRGYFRKRRYAGSKDRRAVRALLFDMLRDWGRARWLAEAVHLPPVARSHALGFAVLNGQGLIDLFGASTYGPHRLDIDEMTAVGRMDAARATLPDYAVQNVPEDVFQALCERYGDALETVLPAPNERAPLTLRTNENTTQADTLLGLIEEAGHAAILGAYALGAVVLPQAYEVKQMSWVEDGLAEVQDEASQLCALMVSPPPGSTVVDLCAGAGGKALAIAARHPKVKVVACDVSEKRLAELKLRAERAKLDNIDVITLPSAYPNQDAPDLAKIAGAAHWVLVDAPCGSSGTWRRHPALRYRYSVEDIQGFAQKQLSLARAGVSLLRQGGRLTFATCSILPQEGEGVLSALLSQENGLSPIAYEALLSGCVKKMPDTLSNIKEWLLLSPPMHDCDGFFCGTMRFQQ
ncbi:MAG: RsmB/NOP family class I SAM-dependent RNA methyltransferase [Pseudomonadota bacterium]